MSRRQVPDNVRPPVSLEPVREIANINIEVITAMFGGGAQPGQSDDEYRIRPAAVRGHLRFWWRACNARRFEDLREMKIEESCLWGSAAKKGDGTTGPGAIVIQATSTNGTHTANFTAFPPLPVFPFRANNKTGEAAKPGYVGITFTLRLTLAGHVPSHRQDECIYAARQALWAWIRFGGVGARARRGCGALAYKDGSVSPCELSAESETDLFTAKGVALCASKLVRSGAGLPQIPSLHQARLLVGANAADVQDAWKKATQPLANFRQGREIGRNYGVDEVVNGQTLPRPGQSRWPEPGAIRAYFQIPKPGRCGDKKGYSYHRPPTNADFPRADLGLPIVFQQFDPGGRDDREIRLEGSRDGHTRMASPIVLKPMVVCIDGVKQYAPIALCLDAPHLYDQDSPDLVLTRTRTRTTVPISPQPMTATTNWPFDPKRPPQVDGKSSARDAFMGYAQGLWQTEEVTL